MRVHVCAAAALASIMVAFGSGPAGAQPFAPAAGAETGAPAPATFTVQVLGVVMKPGTHALAEGARLSDAIAAAGMSDVDAANARIGIPADARGCTAGGADLHRVFLVRVGETSRSLLYQIDVARAREHNDARYDPLLRANDKVYVPECRSSRFIFTPPIAPRAST